MIRLKKRKPGFFEQVIAGNQIMPATDRKQGLLFLVSFIEEVRPGGGKRKDATRNLQFAIEQIRNNRVLLANLQHALLSQLSSTDLTSAITESGIPLARGFWQELSNRLKHKILPPLLDEDDFLYVIQTVFYRKNDFVWVESVPRKNWLDFFRTAAFNFGMAGIEFRKELMQAMKILSYQVAQLGLEKVVLDYLPKEDQHHDTPFVIQNYKVHELENLLEQNAGPAELVLLSGQLKEDIQHSYELIDHIRESHTEKGASIQQTYILLILSNRLQRMQLILDALDADDQFDTGRFVDIFRMLIRNEKRKNSIREFLSQ